MGIGMGIGTGHFRLVSAHGKILMANMVGVLSLRIGSMIPSGRISGGDG